MRHTMTQAKRSLWNSPMRRSEQNRSALFFFSILEELLLDLCFFRVVRVLFLMNRGDLFLNTLREESKDKLQKLLHR